MNIIDGQGNRMKSMKELGWFDPIEATITETSKGYYVLVAGGREVGGTNLQTLTKWGKKEGYKIAAIHRYKEKFKLEHGL